MEKIYAFMKKKFTKGDLGTFHSLNNYSIDELEKMHCLASELKDMTLSLRAELDFIAYKFAADNPNATPGDFLRFNANILTKIMSVTGDEVKLRNFIEKKKNS